MVRKQNIPSSSFKYTSLNPEIRDLVQRRTNEIKILIRLTAQNLIEIGDKLHEVKQALGHGYFGLWLKAEFNWSVATATKMMQASRKFKNINFTNLNFSASAIYLLAAPSTPETAITEALYRSERGESITYSLAKKLVNHHKQSQLEKDIFDIEVLPQIKIAETPPTDNLIDNSWPAELNLLFSQSVNPIIEKIPEQFSPMVEPKFFLEYLRREWLRMIREKNFLSLIVCAIDDLPFADEFVSNVNYGTYLKNIIQVLQQTIKRPGDIFSYFGEGTFIILLSLTESQGAKQVAEKIRTNFQQSQFPSVDNNHDLTISLLVRSLHPSSITSVKSFLSLLIKTLKTLQKQKKNFVFILSDFS